ncbi:MAG: ribonuclease HI [Anaerolinea sp.]
MKRITIYTDGACIGNPGTGGYAAILINENHRKEITGGFQYTTNNRMELMAAIAALEALKMTCEVDLYSDSKYLVENFNSGAVFRWREKGWKRNKKEPAENVDLWEKFLTLCEKHRVRLYWVMGHQGNPENERCDFLAHQMARRKDLPRDIAFEEGSTRSFEPSLF